MIGPVLFILMMLQACAAPAGLELRVMSFNVRWDGLDQGRHAWAHRRPVAVEVVRAHAPDVIGLQEPSAAQTRDLDEALEDYASFTGEHERDLHLPLLYRTDRFRLGGGGSFWLVEESDLPGGTRRCVWVRLVEESTGQAFYVYNVHFDHRCPASRRQSARALIRGIEDREPADPFVVVGDFNEVEDGAAMQYLTGRAALADEDGAAAGSTMVLVDTFRDRHPSQLQAATGHGFTGRVHGVRIDYILVTRQDEILEARILHDHRQGLYPSDHYPIAARVRLVPRAQAVSPNA